MKTSGILDASIFLLPLQQTLYFIFSKTPLLVFPKNCASASCAVSGGMYNLSHSEEQSAFLIGMNRLASVSLCEAVISGKLATAAVYAWASFGPGMYTAWTGAESGMIEKQAARIPARVTMTASGAM